MAAMNVPARRWATRADLIKMLDRGMGELDTAPLDRASVAYAASAAALSLHHFIRLFRQAYGLSPHRYLTMRRIEEAKRLLATTDLSVGTICVEIGFASPSAFSRLFKAHVGMPPLAYRLKSKA